MKGSGTGRWNEALLSSDGAETMQSKHLFEAALGVRALWYVRETIFDAEGKLLTIRVSFRSGNSFSHAETAGEHPVHDTQIKRYRHLNFFQYVCGRRLAMVIAEPKPILTGRINCVCDIEVKGVVQTLDGWIGASCVQCFADGREI